MANKDLVYIGGLWKNTTSKGDTYMSGSFGIAGKVLIFKNANKQSDKDPDYRLYIAPKEQQDSGQKQAQTAPKGNDSDVPF